MVTSPSGLDRPGRSPDENAVSSRSTLRRASPVPPSTPDRPATTRSSTWSPATIATVAGSGRKSGENASLAIAAPGSGTPSTAPCSSVDASTPVPVPVIQPAPSRAKLAAPIAW